MMDWRWALVVILVTSAGCGDAGDGPALAGETPLVPVVVVLPPEQNPWPPVGEPSQCSEPSPAEVPLRRLTRTEYDNTVRDLLGDDSRLAEANFVPDGLILGFPTPGPVTIGVAEDLQAAAETLASRAVEDLPALMPCDPQQIGQEECARLFIETFGFQVYRQPLESDQIARLMAVYTASSDAGDPFEDRIRQVITGFLQSPFFLYRLEIGSPNPLEGTVDVVPLSGWEVASRLSYLMWASMPDDELLNAAADGALQTPEQIEAQARRMLNDPRAREAVTRFFIQWLEVEGIRDVIKDTQQYPEFDDGLRESMLRETELFIEDVIWSDDPSLDALLTAPYTYVDRDLASFYGIEGVDSDGFVKVALPNTRAGGILGQGSLLASHASPSQSSPVLRGKFVRTRVLCQEVPDPPAELNVAAPDPEPGLTTRELYKEHTQDDFCAGCHQLMDPIGFGFEHFDAAGLYRAEEQGKPIDSSGEFVGTDVDGEFDGVEELAMLLSSSDEVRSCVAKQWFRYGFNRLESEENVCTVQAMTEALAASNNDLRELLIALTRTDAFRYRRAIQTVEGE
jgi:hypothetical protein